MKTATVTLKAFLAASQQFAMADLYTFTLSGGLVLRWTNADIPVTDDTGAVFLPAKISRTGTKLTRGVQVDSLDISIAAGDSDLINGQPVIPFIVNGGLRGATVALRRAFFANWGQPLQGCVTLFAGRFSQMKQAAGTEIQITVKSWLELLNVQMPQNLYQPPCLHVLFDAGCTLSAAAFAVNGSITTSSSALVFGTGLTQAAGYFDQGRIVFTSGGNAGQKRAIKAQTGGGVLSVALALPVAPAVGDTFTVFPGCDHSQATCSTKFSNLINFRGMPYVPVAETSV